MKKIIPLLFLTLLLSASFPPPISSFYHTSPLTATGAALHQDLGWVTFDTTSFDGQFNGFYILQDNTFVTSYSGLAKLTGNCRQVKPSNISLRVIITNYAAPLVIVTTSDEVFSFVLPFIAGNVQLQGYNNDPGRYDVVKCYLLFEKVQ